MSKGYPKNYRLPAEFEPQEAIWLSWPSNKESCPKTFHKLQDKFGEIASTISRYERVRINATASTRFVLGTARRGAELDESLELPAGFNPRTLAWARSFRNDPARRGATASQLAQDLLRHVRTQGYSYTLAPGDVAVVREFILGGGAR